MLKLLKCVLVAALVALASCSADISGSLNASGGGDFTVSAALQPNMAAVIRSFMVLSGKKRTNTLDGAVLTRSLSNAPGISAARLDNTSPVTVTGPVTVSRIEDFLAPAGGRGFITLEQADKSRLSVQLNRDNGPAVLALISPDIIDYLSALMAPVATGEVLSTAEYLDLVRSVYGGGVAGDIQKGKITAAIDFPGPIVSVKGGVFKDQRAEFSIPLLELLVLDTPLEYEIVW